MNVTIPKCNENHDNYPCWVPITNSNKETLKPIIRCQCGAYCGIGLHHVHEDGRVTASFYHKKEEGQTDPHIGCDWHVFLTLENYDLGEFLPIK